MKETYSPTGRLANSQPEIQNIPGTPAHALEMLFARYGTPKQDTAPIHYGEVWIVLYGMGQRVSLETGAMFKVDSKPVVRFELVHHDRYAGFTVSPEDWTEVGNDGAAQMAFLRLKVQEARDRLYEVAE